VKKIVFLMLAFILFLNTVIIQPAAASDMGCSASMSSFMTIFLESISTLYNIFPIDIGGVSIRLMNLPDKNEIGGIPICVCTKGVPPLPHIGIKFAWWNPQAVIETTKAPFCFPSLGFGLGDVLGGKFYGEGWSGSISAGNGYHRTAHDTFLEAHYIKYPTILLLNILLNSACMGSEGDIDLFYLSEVEPTWGNDELSVLKSPEEVLFANPAAQLACTADAAKSIAGFPSNDLFWCMGTWGSSYPMGGNKHGHMNMAAAGLAARTIYTMSRLLMLRKTVGSGNLCGSSVMPVWYKTEFCMYEGYPKLWSKRFPIGKDEDIWGADANPPVPGKDDNYVWFLYQHHECCMF